MGGLKQAFCHLVIIKGKFIGCEDSQHNHHAVLPVHNTGKTVYYQSESQVYTSFAETLHLLELESSVRFHKLI